MADRCLLYYITDRAQFPGDEPARRTALLAKIAEAVRAGVDYIQLREKDLTAQELESLALQAIRVIREISNLRTENRELRTRFLINSRTDVALAVGADGVHLRSDDVSPTHVRRVWREAIARSSPPAARSPVVSVSCHTPADVVRAQAEGADFAVFGPVFAKRGASPAGLAALREACKVKIPVLALGGIMVEKAAACLEAGAAGIAGIRLFQENEIEGVVRALRTSVGAANNLW
jgi:thiamine-phosphate pyrophosphorylase